MGLPPSFPQRLAERLLKPLPGPMVGTRFEPSPRPWRRYDAAPPDARPAAVLILLYPHQGQWRLPLLLRPEGSDVHGGQVCLPGGAVEPGESESEAALREFHEELGDDGQPIQLLGALSPIYVEASRYRVAPWVGFMSQRPDFAPNPDEVAELIEMPVEHLFDPAHFGHHRREYQGRSYTAPHFCCQSHRIWGATCLILGELATVLEGLIPCVP